MNGKGFTADAELCVVVGFWVVDELLGLVDVVGFWVVDELTGFVDVEGFGDCEGIGFVFDFDEVGRDEGRDGRVRGGLPPPLPFGERASRCPSWSMLPGTSSRRVTSFSLKHVTKCLLGRVYEDCYP